MESMTHLFAFAKQQSQPQAGLNVEWSEDRGRLSRDGGAWAYFARGHRLRHPDLDARTGIERSPTRMALT